MTASETNRKATKAPPMRNGAQFLDAIREDGRRVYFDGELVRDVTIHRPFAVQRNRWRGSTMSPPTPQSRGDDLSIPVTGGPVLRCYHIPKTAADLASRRGMSTRWAEETFGLMGRTPDHVAGFLAGYAAKPSVFAEAGSNMPRTSCAITNMHATITNISPTPSCRRRSIAPSRHTSIRSYAPCRRGAERDGGIVLKGAQQLGTGAVFSDAIYISCIHPLVPGDEAYAFAVAVPANAPGLKIYPRRSYASAQRAHSIIPCRPGSMRSTPDRAR